MYPNTRHATSRREIPPWRTPTLNLSTSEIPLKVTIGLDFGATFTSPSFAITPVDDGDSIAFPKEIQSIVNWPNDLDLGMRKQVPSESWYSQGAIDRDPGVDDKVLEQNLYDNWKSQHPLVPTGRLINGELIEDIEDPEMGDESSLGFLWGYGAFYGMHNATFSRNPTRYVKRVKLMLVETEHTDQDRKDLRRTLNGLLDEGVIRRHGKRSKTEVDMWDAVDPISDYLVKILHHTKEQLKILHGFADHPVDFVMTVPTVWSAEASRVLQHAVKASIIASGLGNPDGSTADNMFIISEPEAAATFLLENSDDISLGETFIIADCGGGTVDVVTYGVSNQYPLRLKEEKITPIGDNCGSSYLNENYKAMLLSRLRDEHYLLQFDETLETIVNRLIPEFEYRLKRPANVMKRMGQQRVYITGLRCDAAKRFETNYLLMDISDYKDMFMPLLHRISALLDDQIYQAVGRGLVVKKLFLVGGFGDSPSLRSYLKYYLQQKNESCNSNIELVVDEKKCITAVASGAVLRALDKRNGPKRITQSSYGFLRNEEWQPERYIGHQNAKKRRNEIDHEPRVTTIRYFMLKGQPVIQNHRFKPLPTYHLFPPDEKDFVCEELVYVSDTATASHYPLDSLRNKDAQVAGRVLVNISALHLERIIQLVEPEARTGIVDHYKVEYELVAIVDGRALRYEVVWPMGGGGEVIAKGQFSIASAFKTGTA